MLSPQPSFWFDGNTKHMVFHSKNVTPCIYSLFSIQVDVAPEDQAMPIKQSLYNGSYSPFLYGYQNETGSELADFASHVYSAGMVPESTSYSGLLNYSRLAFFNISSYDLK